ncbi:MAG TPA: ATP-binding cassette domain-containing protein [Candidatus Paceibacterota bacterium]|nr:ATP-binding cassette domain-containing protein [Candidatus Paceibacterota bacterium]
MEKENKKQKIDPICGMDVTDFSDSPEAIHNNKKFYFCSNFCHDRFKRNPEKFSKEPLVKISNVWKIFSPDHTKTEVLKGLNLHIWEGDFVVVIGPSGSGKSTTLNIVGLLDKPTSGHIYLKGKNISTLDDNERAKMRSKTFGFVFQQYNLIPWLTAYENATLPLIFSTKKASKKKNLEHLFDEIGLKERLDHFPSELSGGEQQRTALLRALANDPDILLGDEPTGNLDSVTGKKILDLLIDLHKVHKKTLLIVTHDMDIAELADQVITFKDGRIIRNHETHKKAYVK